MTAVREPRSRRVAAVALLALVAVAGLPARADDATPRPVMTGATAPVLQPDRPFWLELTVSQRLALTPLVNDWEHLDGQTKKKWVEIANRYPRMRPDEQTRTQERMREWATLTPEQRRVARDSFARVRAMPPEQRADLLRKYRELPPEKKQALENQAKVSKALVVPKTPPPGSAEAARRVQIREGAQVRNPAVAAQKSASPVAAPIRGVARPVPLSSPSPSPVVTGAPLPDTPPPTPSTAPAAALPGAAPVTKPAS